MMAHVFESLAPIWDNRKEFLAASVCLDSALAPGLVRRVKRNERPLSVYSCTPTLIKNKSLNDLEQTSHIS